MDWDEDDLTPEMLDALIEESDPDAQELLADALTHPERAVRIHAALRLGEVFHDVRAVVTLAEAMVEADWQTRKEAASALWEIGDANPAELIRALHFEHGSRLDAIVDALELSGWIPDDVSAEVTYRIVTWRWAEIIVIGPPAVPGLLSALSDPDGRVRRGSAWALGKIGDARAVPWLINLLSDSEGGLLGIGERVCDIAAEALERIGTPEALEAVSQWQADQAM